jgi:hypothetical protein
MSLGYNPGRPHKTTNLPGNVGASIARNSTTVSAPRKRAPLSTAVGGAKEEELAQQVDHVKSRDRPLQVDVTNGDHHWFFATCTKPLLSVDGVQATRAGERVLLVYPMQSVGPSRVSIRMKSIDPITASLSYSWVIVYDDEDDEYLIDDCSFCP